MDKPPRRSRRKLMVFTLLALFLLPVAARAALFAYAHGPMSWRDAPALGVTMPQHPIGPDYRPYPYAGLSDSRTCLEASLWGVLGVKLGWVEGIELNVLGLVAGVDLRHPALKLPGFGRIGFESAVASAASRPAPP